MEPYRELLSDTVHGCNFGLEVPIPGAGRDGRRFRTVKLDRCPGRIKAEQWGSDGTEASSQGWSRTHAEIDGIGDEACRQLKWSAL